MTFRRILLTAAILIYPLAVAAQTRTPVPSAEAQQKALGLLRELYKKEYDEAQTPAAKEALAEKLLNTARDVKVSADRYAVLRVARDLSLEAGGTTCFRAVDAMAEDYRIDALDMKSKLLAKCSSTAKTPQQRKAVAETGTALANQALAEDRFEVAAAACDALLAAARRARDAELVKQVAALKMKVAEVAKAAAEARQALAALQTNPNDPAANLVAGKYYCLTKGSWNKGLQMLALATDSDLKALAARELAGPAAPNDQVALGDGWWALAEKESGVEKEQLHTHAARWYEQALPGLTGLTKTRIEKRLQSLKPPDEKPATVDLLKSADPKTHTAAGQWQIIDGELQGISDRRFSRGAGIVLPCDSDGDYRLQFEFTRTRGSNRIAAILPVGSTQCMLALSGNGDYSGVELIDGEQFKTNASRVADRIVNGQRYRLDIRVLKQGEDVLIQADLDGKSHVRWSGPLSQLSPSTYCKLPERKMLGVGVGPPGPTHVTFHEIKFMKLTGQSVPPGKTPRTPKRMDLTELLTSTKWVRQGQIETGEKTDFLFVFNPGGVCIGGPHGKTSRSSGHTKWKLQGNVLFFATDKGGSISWLQFDPRRKVWTGAGKGWQYIMYPAGNR